MSEDVEKPVTEHIVELTERLRTALLAVIAVLLALYLVPSAALGRGLKPLIFYLMVATEEYMLDFSKPLLKGLASALGLGLVSVRLISSGVFDTFIASFYLALLIALFAAGPIVAWEVYAYVRPALYSHELKVLKRYAAASAVLFVLGALYAYLFLLPLTFLIMTWLCVAGGAEPIFSVSSFFHTVFIGVLFTGAFFTTPVALVGLVEAGLIEPKVLREKWRYVVLGLFALTAVVTPDPTPVTMTLLSVPFVALYLLTIALAERGYRRRAQ